MRETGPEPSESNVVPVSLSRFLAYFLRLGTTGFGGPIALAGHMQRDLVEGRRWVSKQDYVEGLAFSQLSPGPLAAQLAMYLGWLQAGALGACASPQSKTHQEQCILKSSLTSGPNFSVALNGPTRGTSS